MPKENKKKIVKKKKITKKSAIVKKTPKKIVSKDKFHTEPLAVGYDGKKLFLLFRKVSSDDLKQELCITSGKTDTVFDGAMHKIKIINGKNDEDISSCSEFKFSGQKAEILTYIRKSEKGSFLVYATTKDMKKWTVLQTLTHIRNSGVVVTDSTKTSLAGSHIYFGDQILKIARQKNGSKNTFEIVQPPRVPHWQFFEGVPFSIFGGINFENYIIVFYSALHTVDIMKDVNLYDQKIGEEKLLKIGFALFAKNEPTRLLWQSELPIVEVPIETHGDLTVLGVVVMSKKTKTTEQSFRIYTASGNGDIGYIDLPYDLILDNKNRKQIQLNKWSGNPMFGPTSLDWERDAAFNPTALDLGGKVHLLYRAIGPDGVSRIGYVSSKDGVHVDERLKYPIYTPHSWFDVGQGETSEPISQSLLYSGGSWGGGCEDPKVTQIGDRVYMTYVAFTGSWPTRTVLTSISVDDFLKKKWRWSKPMLMSPPGVGSKSVVLFPEKINGKYYVFHRMWPNIMIDTVDNLNFGEGKQYLTGHHMIRPRKSFWDSRKLSVGATPIKTNDGWLVIYNAVDRLDSSKYKIGAMLLDLKNPTKVLARSRKPILSPEEFYENDGKPGVAYPGGAIDLNGILHVYYGGGDKVSAVAKIPINDLVQSLKKDAEPKMHITKLKDSHIRL